MSPVKESPIKEKTSAPARAKAVQPIQPQKDVTKKPELLVRTLKFDSEHYANVLALAAFNSLRGAKPDTTSGVVGAALDLYFSQVDDDFWKLRETLGK
jgi:hypothetical protein